jgi:hypothetical protein
MKHVVFYSWQSDLPNGTNRSLIENALEMAVENLKNDDDLRVEPVLDRDTTGVAGSPDIAQTIFSKIHNATAFVCDVSIINSQAPGPGASSFRRNWLLIWLIRIHKAEIFPLHITRICAEGRV